MHAWVLCMCQYLVTAIQMTLNLPGQLVGDLYRDL